MRVLVCAVACVLAAAESTSAATLPRATTPATAVAQDVHGTLAGRIVAVDGEPLEGALVRVARVDGGRTWTVPTDGAGRFRFPRLTPGSYTVEVERLGYRSVRFAGVAVDLGRVTRLPVTSLSVAAVPLAALEVEVRPLRFDPTSTSLGETLRAESMERLPLGRSFDSMLQLLPQANESFLGDPVNVAGSTGLENAYFVEGVQVTDVFRSRGGTALPSEFVEAVEVIRGGYEAEYGGALGGIVNVVTRSGGEEFRARAFGSWTGSALAGDAAAVPGVLDPADFSEFDVGITASGPLAPGRAWFFAAYDPSVVRQDLELPGLGAEEARVTRHRFAAKVDTRLGADTDLALSLFGDPSTERRVQPSSSGVQLLEADPILTRAREGGLNAALRASTTFRDRVMVEVVASHHEGREDLEGATEKGRAEPTLIDRRSLPGIRLSGGNQSDQRLDTRRTSLRASGSLFAGRHTVKAGLQVQDMGLDLLVREDPGQVTRLADDLWQAAFLIQDFDVGNRVTTLWLQDSWEVTDRWRLNLGLRWEGQALRDQNGDVGQRIDDQFQPRAGFVWQPGRSGNHKVFGHAGRFYQQMALHWATLALAGFDQRQAFYSVDPRLSPEAVDSTRVFSDPSVIRGGSPDLQGEHHDEVVLGYERQVGRWTTVAVRGLRRELRSSVTLAFGTDGELAAGNPGRGALAHLPASTRTYTALEVGAERRSRHTSLRFSWVWSRTEGNYPGLYAADAGGLRGGSFGPNNDQLSYFASQRVNSEGPLPNDRPHVVKLSGARAFEGGLTVGVTGMVSSGTPLSEFGRVPSGFNTPLFLAPRGSGGRSPAIWDLSLRLAYDLSALGGGRVVVDLLHLGNPRTVVRIDQRRFNGARGSPFASWEELVENQRGEREAYGAPITFQPPFAVRLGLQIGVGG